MTNVSWLRCVQMTRLAPFVPIGHGGTARLFQESAMAFSAPWTRAFGPCPAAPRCWRFGAFATPILIIDPGWDPTGAVGLWPMCSSAGSGSARHGVPDCHRGLPSHRPGRSRFAEALSRCRLSCQARSVRKGLRESVLRRSGARRHASGTAGPGAPDHRYRAAGC